MATATQSVATCGSVISASEFHCEEFINGILRCRGPARAIDQVAMRAELKHLDLKLARPGSDMLPACRACIMKETACCPCPA